MIHSTHKTKPFILIFVLGTLLFSGTSFSNTTEILSNGLLEIRVNAIDGTYDLINVGRNEIIFENAKVGFVTAPYLELDEVKKGSSETDVPVYKINSTDCKVRVKKGTNEGILLGSRTLSLIMTDVGKGEMEIKFSLYPDQTFIDIGFSFKNLDKEPIRLRRVDVLRAERVFPGNDLNKLKLLNGDSGGKTNQINSEGKLSAENNMLYFFADENQPRSLVLGGLSYADYRKFIKSDHGANQGAVLYAKDPVGRRVDPGQTYNSPDHFYANGLTDNPFDALEEYAKWLKKAQDIHLNYYTFPSTCMWFLSVRHFGGDKGSTNNTVGAVREMENIANSGFLKYSPAAVRLVPDCYEQNNQQGWWDDKHWQMHGRKERCIVERHYEKPFETTEKWGQAVQELGGIPFIYFQPGIRSEDYAEAYPHHMLYNEAHKYILKEGKRVSDPHRLMGIPGIDDKPGYGKLWQESYDYTDPDFIAHLRDGYANLRNGKVKGVFYDYPDRAFSPRGGMEDRYSTATAAYRNVFSIARKELGIDAFLQERLGIGSDAILGLVSSVRTAGDNNIIRPNDVKKVALRWYKNRRLVNYDMDGKAILHYGHKRGFKISENQRRTILTISYAITGRLLLTESFRLFPEEVLYDLSRIFPFHETPLSARPIDAFISDLSSVFDFPITPDWHQLVLFNHEEQERLFTIPVSGNTAFGALGLESDRDYYLYDFWNDRFAGRVNGNNSIKQNIEADETRMLSVHAIKERPQWISTNRHIMQGYVDLIHKPVWNESKRELIGKSFVIKNEPYKIVIALNDFSPKSIESDATKCSIRVRDDKSGLADLVLNDNNNSEINWTVTFNRKKK